MPEEGIDIEGADEDRALLLGTLEFAKIRLEVAIKAARTGEPLAAISTALAQTSERITQAQDICGLQFGMFR